MRKIIFFMSLCITAFFGSAQSPFNIRSDHDKYYFTATEAPNDLISAGILSPLVSYSFQWQISDYPLESFIDISGETQQDLHFSTALAGTKYFSPW